MAATVPAAFDPKPTQLGLVVDCIAASAILAGQVVAFNSTGVGYTVEPSNGVTTAGVVGVALNSQATVGGHVAVAGAGSVIKVCAGSAVVIDAGDLVAADVSTALGCVIAEADATQHYQVGVALEDFVANAAGYVLLTPPYLVTKGA